MFTFLIVLGVVNVACLEGIDMLEQGKAVFQCSRYV